eukprot:TCALIF_01098-PA protein Name:"Similar to CG31690 Transmembrane and TPR repeat-containing protein CG31690 (Drosophila melanogaster)" AED:0.17 eAED:0.17 QI:8/0.66/0.9/0.9/0.77/0.8/10/79/596
MLDRKKADEEAEEEKEERNSGFGTRNDTREHERTEIMESKRNSKCSWNCLKECPHFFVVFGFVTLVYWNSLTGDFVHDDNPAILQNPMVTDANTSIWNILTHDFWGTQLDSSASHKSFRPITTLVFRLLFQWGGGSPVPFHVFNLCLHTFVTWAIATLPSKLMPSTTDTTTATKSLSFNCLAALFIVQSIHTETVSGLVGAADLLATSLSIISVYLFHKFRIRLGSYFVLAKDFRFFRCLSVVYMFARIFLVTRFCPWPIFSPMDNPAAFHSSIFTRAGVKTLPHNAKAHYNLANACKDNGRLEVAVAHYKEAIKLWPTYTEAHNNLAAILPDPKEATKHLEMALTIDPGHPTSLYNLALMLSQDGQCAQAIPLLERSLVERYNFEPAQRLLLECLRLSPKFESNPHQFLLPMDIHSEVDLTLNELVDVYIRMRHWDKAFQLLHFCLEKRPSSSVAYYQLSQVYFEQRKINLALEAVEMAKRTCLQTNFCSQIQLQEADIWQESLDFERAAEGYKEALQQFPDDSRILLNLGSSYHMMGERHKARQYYEKALALNPSNSLAQTNLALLQWEQTNKTLGSSWFWDHQSLSTSFQNDI